MWKDIFVNYQMLKATQVSETNLQKDLKDTACFSFGYIY